MAFYSSFAQYYESIFPFKKFVFDFLNYYANPETRDILDVGCGTGHYADHFAQAGYHVIGIDLDAAMIDYARQHYPDTHFLALNMLDIQSLEQPFDFIYCIGNTATHLKQDQFDIFVQSAYNKLRSGGIWLFQVLNWDCVTRQQEYIFPVLYADNEKIKFIRKYSDISNDSVIFNTELVDRGYVIFKEFTEMYPISSQEYLDIHHSHQFRLLDHFANFKRTPFNPRVDSANIFVFQK